MSIQETLSLLLGKDADPVAAAYRLRELAEGDAASSIAIVAQLSTQSTAVSESDPAIVGALLRVVHSLLLQDRSEDSVSWIRQLQPEVVAQVDAALPTATPNRHLLLQLLAFARTTESLETLVAILVVRPPADWMNAAQVLSPLMQHDDWPIEAVYPKLLDCLAFPSLAASLLDLANYLQRSGRAASHPAAGMLMQLNELLGEVAKRLDFFEENPRTFGDDVPTVQNRLGEAVSLAVSLCDAVALIGDESSIGKLNQALALRHRRVQCEAAGALAKLGDTAGRERLIELAAEPAARLRAIAYADELDLGDEIDEQYRSDDATAEAQLALWLSQPHQMGVPPTQVEVVESRRLLWPSFNDPVDITLVRFEYNMGDRCYSNVGITGPVVYTLGCDLAELPIDDIFAIYAGWHAEHPDIFTVTPDGFNEGQIRAMEQLSQHLQHLGYDEINSALLGIFLDERAGIFSAVREGTRCLVVTDGLETIDQATEGRLRPLEAEDLFNLYKGRKMLRTFNA